MMMSGRIWQDNNTCYYWPEDGKGYKTVEVGPVDLWKSSEGESGTRRRYLHRGKQWCCQGNNSDSVDSK